MRKASPFSNAIVAIVWCICLQDLFCVSVHTQTTGDIPQLSRVFFSVHVSAQDK